MRFSLDHAFGYCLLILIVLLIGCASSEQAPPIKRVMYAPNPNVSSAKIKDFVLDISGSKYGDGTFIEVIDPQNCEARATLRQYLHNSDLVKQKKIDINPPPVAIESGRQLIISYGEYSRNWFCEIAVSVSFKKNGNYKLSTGYDYREGVFGFMGGPQKCKLSIESEDPLEHLDIRRIQGPLCNRNLKQ